MHFVLVAKYQVNILKKLRSINVDYHQVGWYQSTYLSSHITKDFLESHVRYQQAIEESIVLIYGECVCVLFVCLRVLCICILCMRVCVCV